MNFQVTILKVLVSYRDGFAGLDDLKRDVAILATCGTDWSERTKRLAARIPSLEIFSQGLVERLEGGWRITQQGRHVLALTEAPLAQTATVHNVVHPTEPVTAKVSSATGVQLCRSVVRAALAESTENVGMRADAGGLDQDEEPLASSDGSRVLISRLRT
jgi:hypothetical protein